MLLSLNVKMYLWLNYTQFHSLQVGKPTKSARDQIIVAPTVCEGNIDAEAYVGILERHMLLSRWPPFPGTPCLFQQDNARPHSAGVTTTWLRRHRVCAWLVCMQSRSVSYWKCMAHHEGENQTTGERRPQAVEQLKSCIHQEWAKLQLQNSYNRYLQFPNGGDVAQVKAVVWQSEGCRFDPTLGVSKCPWARHLTPNRSWRAGWYLAWQPIAVGVWMCVWMGEWEA